MAVLLAIGIGGASATAGGAKDHVRGGGSNGSAVDNHFSINALSAADGSDARGRFEFHDTESGPPTERFDAEVRCLRVVGNRATVVGRITNSRPNEGLEGRYVIVRLEDNGPPRRGESVDEIRNALQPADAPQPSCPPPADIADRGLSNGNIVIDDN
jgi:hypothetical protein